MLASNELVDAVHICRQTHVYTFGAHMGVEAICRALVFRHRLIRMGISCRMSVKVTLAMTQHVCAKAEEGGAASIYVGLTDIEPQKA